MVNDRNKRGIHTVRGRLGSPRTPMIAFNSVIVTCLARSTACATCCWCCGDRGWVRAGHVAPRQVPPTPKGHPDPPLFIFFIIVFNFFFTLFLAHDRQGAGFTSPAQSGHSRAHKASPGVPPSLPHQRFYSTHGGLSPASLKPTPAPQKAALVGEGSLGKHSPHPGHGNVLTSCDRKGMICAKIVFSLLAISV